MAVPSSVFKTAKKNNKDTWESSSSSVRSNEFKNDGVSLLCTGKLQKIYSDSSKRLSFINHKDFRKNSNISFDYEKYDLDYSTYLLRKIQNKILTKNNAEKTEHVKKCFVSLKLEFEQLLEKYVKLSNDVAHLKVYLEIIKQCDSAIEMGKKVLRAQKENDYENLLKNLSESLNFSVNQLLLKDIDRDLIDKVFSDNVLGTGSEIDECLKRIHQSIDKNKEQVLKVATELTEIQHLFLENSILRKKCNALFLIHSNKILESNYEHFVTPVINSMEKREECKNDFATLLNENIINVQEIVQSLSEPVNASQLYLSLQSLKLENSYLARPNSSSTPQPEHHRQ